MALGAGLHLLERREGTDMARNIRGQMDRHVRHVSRLVEDLLDIARIDQGKISLNKERIILQDALTFAIEASQPSIDAAGHALAVDMPDAPVWIEADYTRIAQIASNLLNNAAKYTPPGGAIRLTAQIVDDRIEIAVADNGIGIPAEMQAKIFDIFAQVRSGKNGGQEGLGIGLALVKQLVELHDGDIRLASSDPASGSVFVVRLPCLAAEVDGRTTGQKRKVR
ncbi:sensor histidine kinase [Sphingobium scionense]